MRARPVGIGPRTVVVIAGLCACAALAAVVIAAVLRPAALSASHLIDNSLTALAWSAVGAVLARHAPGARILPLVLVVAAAATVTTVAGTWSTLPVPGAPVAGWISGWTWLVATAVPLTLVLLRVSRVGPATPAERTITVGAVVGLLATCLGVGLSTGTRADTRSTVGAQSPWGIDLLATTGVAVLVLAAAATLVTLGRRVLHADPAGRSPLAPVVAGTAITVAGIALGAAVPGAAPVVQAVTTPALPLSVCLAVLHFRLYDSAAAIRRSVVSAALTAIAVVVYAGAVAALTLVVGRTDPAVAITLGFALLVAFLPAQARMRRVITHALYGDRDMPERLTVSLGAQLVGAGDPASAVRGAVSDLLPALRVPWAAITVDGRTTVEAGSPAIGGHSVHRLPLVHLGAIEGVLLVAGRSPVDPLDHRDLRFLAAIAVPIAAVLASARLAADMQRSRQELILAREEERRRVRRDLHDDVGPLLSALMTQTDVAVLALDRSPDGTRERLRRIHATGRDALDALRRVAHDLHPPVTDDLGLRGALLEVAATLSTPATTVRVDVDLPAADGGTTAAVPAATELAVYRIAGEALGNAVRHAGARIITVTVRSDGGHVRLLVEDDGCGFCLETAVAGMGLRSMRDRATELGGDFDLRSGPDGTAVVASFPLPTGGDRVKVLVCDDHPVYREGLRLLLDELEIETVAQAATAEEALAHVDRDRPDVVIMDLHMPGMGGLEAIRRLTAHHPQVRILVLTMLDSDTTVLAALRAGAAGYLVKGADHTEIRLALDAVVGGHLLVTSVVADRVRAAIGVPATPAFPHLTGREREILELMCRGRSNEHIAATLLISGKTVRNLVSSVLAKLQATSRTHAVAIARDAGIGRPPE